MSRTFVMKTSLQVAKAVEARLARGDLGRLDLEDLAHGLHLLREAVICTRMEGADGPAGDTRDAAWYARERTSFFLQALKGLAHLDEGTHEDYTVLHCR